MNNRDAYFRSRKALGPLHVKVGDKVSYTRYFLKCIGVPATDEMWFRRGRVVAVSEDVATVRWDGEDETKRALTANLAHPGPNLRFCE